MSSKRRDIASNLSDEFPANGAEPPQGVTRREFLRVMAASFALAGATACTRQSLRKIVPYRDQPEEIVPGKPLYFASALTLGGFARGILVVTHEGRPTKIEGNPGHPASLGGSDVFMQAELLTLYDPDRSRTVAQNGQIATWDAISGEFAKASNQWGVDQGAGLRLLTPHETSPTLLDQMRRLLAKYPAAKWHEFDPVPFASDGPRFHFEKAEVILSLDADFLCHGAAGLAYSREFARSRRDSDRMSRLYVIESTPTLTGSMADHRVPMNPAQIAQLVRELESGGKSELAQNLLADLRAHSGTSLVLAGETQPAEVRQAVRRLNESLGNTGKTVDYRPEPATLARGFEELIEELRSGSVKTLVILGGNPVYDAPADCEFGRLLSKVPSSIHLGIYHNETAAACHWHLPEAHPLECWSDALAFEGSPTIIQPVIEPLFGGRSRHELLADLLREPPQGSYEIVRAFWKASHSGQDFEAFWRKSLHDGVVQATPAAQPAFSTGASEGGASGASHSQSGSGGASPSREGLHLLIRPSAQVYDGRYCNNAWLQEFPEPITKMVWDNAAWISSATASKLGLEPGDVVKLKYRGRSVNAPVWVQPGQAEDCVTIHLGYGRTNAGSIGTGIGFSASAIRPSDALWGGPGLEIEKTGATHTFVTTQEHWSMEGRDQVRVATLAEFRRNPPEASQGKEAAPQADETLYHNLLPKSPAWAMVIDLRSCIGCGACTIACQAENNIPVVGKEQVAAQREMHWIRVDRYYQGPEANPASYHQPVPCMHCENAPCELVCPVAATVHNREGLNQMVYNRCIGTRYCSNNCPYKVRRFNFLEYDADRFEAPGIRRLGRNPNVTVRSRGVMEKCTFCIQRINSAKIEARKANREIRDGEIIPACAQACPAEAIVFGDAGDRKSRVAALKATPLNYALLAELNTRPRTTYLARLRNPNPAISEEK